MPVASDSATHVAPSAVPTASSINLPEGRTLNINVNQGENDPAKKVPVEPKRRYIKLTVIEPFWPNIWPNFGPLDPNFYWCKLK